MNAQSASCSRRTSVRTGIAGLVSMATAAVFSAGAAGVTDGVPIPSGVRTVEVARNVLVNGIPMRLRAFVSADSVDAVVEAFRKSLGQPLVESRLGRQRVLGRPQGDGYWTVQIEAAGTGVRGIVAEADLKAAVLARDSVQAAARKWLAYFPAGARLASSMTSVDAGRSSSHLIVTSEQSKAQVAETLVTTLARDALPLEPHSDAQPEEGGRDDAHADAGRALFFKGPGRTAIATLHRGGRGETVTVLNIVDDASGAR